MPALASLGKDVLWEAEVAFIFLFFIFKKEKEEEGGKQILFSIITKKHVQIPYKYLSILLCRGALWCHTAWGGGSCMYSLFQCMWMGSGEC